MIELATWRYSGHGKLDPPASRLASHPEPSQHAMGCRGSPVATRADRHGANSPNGSRAGKPVDTRL
eukprot:9858008-Prorocentrum_lima.AAC.1